MNKKRNYGILYAVAWHIVNIVFKVIFPTKVYNKERLTQDGAFIIASNHISFLDPIFIELAMHKRKIYFLAKSELFKNKFISAVLTYVGAVCLDRSNGADGIKSAISIVERGEVIGVFPEGTRSKDGNLGRPKSGIMFVAAKCNTDIIPITILTKKQKVKPFRKIHVFVGNKISYNDFNITEGSMKDLRRAGDMLFNQIRTTFENYKKDIIGG